MENRLRANDKFSFKFKAIDVWCNLSFEKSFSIEQIEFWTVSNRSEIAKNRLEQSPNGLF
jgi:hypothetical protein